MAAEDMAGDASAPGAQPEGAAPSPTGAGLGEAAHGPGASEVIARIESQARGLTESERRHLHSHLLADTTAAFNEEVYRGAHDFKAVSILVQNLRAGGKAFLSIAQGQRAIWSEGDESNRLVGLSFSTDADAVVGVRNLLVNAREMYLQAYQDCTSIAISLYVRTAQDHVKGRVDLPPGAVVTLQSRSDRTSVVGLSSFALDLA